MLKKILELLREKRPMCFGKQMPHKTAPGHKFIPSFPVPLHF